jgi:PAS domain S-box-containing protein
MARAHLNWKQLGFRLRGGVGLNGVKDESTARSFHLLLTSVLVWILLFLAVVVPFFAVRKTGGAIICAVLGAATLGSLYLVRADRIRTASLFFLITVWCVAEVFSALNGGLQSGMYGLVVLIIVNAGWLLGRSSAIGLAVATLLISLAEALADYSGHPLPLYFHGNPIGSWIVFGGILLFAVNPILAILEALQRQVAALRESEERFRSLFEQAPIAYNEIDQQGIIRKVNRASCTLLGSTADELVGKFVWDFVEPDLQNFVRTVVIERLNGSRPIAPYDLEFLSKDGSAIPVEMHETLIHGRAGEIAGLRAALLDNRQRKIAEQASRKAAQYNLELKIKNDELAEALESARQANLIKSRFLANMSHELRTPLNGIIGLSEVLHDELLGELSPEQNEYMGDILASGRHLLNLVSNVLDLERVELGKMDFCQEVVDVHQLLREVCDVLRTLADENGVTVSLTVDPALSSVTTDPVRLRQIVYNYLSNAIKFSPSKSVIKVRAAVDRGENFRVDVVDQGPGMSPEQLGSLFTDFHHLDRTQKQAGQGAGLGLALTKRIVEAQGGTVGVESVPGAGSTFHAILPNGRKGPQLNT